MSAIESPRISKADRGQATHVLVAYISSGTRVGTGVRPTGAQWLVQLPMPEALILMKQSANRPQDRADVSRLIEGGISADRVAATLADYGPSLLSRFGALLDKSERMR